MKALALDGPLRVVELDAGDLIWPFSDQGPHWCAETVIEAYRRVERVDPFPCYTHDVGLVRETLRAAARAFPVGVPVTVHVTPWESLSRTNGWASYQHSYEDGRPWEGTVALSGKRTPPHPAVTRYLVAHEYGHIVDYWLCSQRLDARGNWGTLDDEYATLRGLERVTYGGATWHREVGELIANDFRVLVAQVEVDFWPHPGIAHPEDVPNVRAFWGEALASAAWKAHAA